MKPKPTDLSIFFSNAQKNLNCPDIKPKVTSNTWYIGKIRIKYNGQYSQGDITSLVNPIQASTGLDKYADVDPVTAKTINITTN